MTRTVFLAALALSAATLPVVGAAQPSTANLNIARIYHDGPLTEGKPATFRVTVRNGNQRLATPSQEPVIIKLIVLDPAQKRTELEGKIANGVGANGSQTGVVADVPIYMKGTYTLTAYAEVPPKAGRAIIRSPDRTETFTVGAASADGQFDLNVVLTNQRGIRAGGLRVTLFTADGQELGWKTSTGNGEAKFPKLAPSPAGKPYRVEVRRGAQLLAKHEYLMPAQTSAFDIRLATP